MDNKLKTVSLVLTGLSIVISAFGVAIGALQDNVNDKMTRQYIDDTVDEKFNERFGTVDEEA